MSPTPTLAYDPATGDPAVARFALGPLPAGLTQALGAALRQVLLGAVPGPAPDLTGVHGVAHRFRPEVVPGLPAVQLFERLRRVRLGWMPAGTVGLTEARAMGPAVLRAGDLRNVPVTNPELELAQVPAGTELAVEFRWGYGFGTTSRPDAAGEELVPVDAWHSPVTRVAAAVEGDRLLLEVEAPDQRPGEHLRTAAALLQEHVGLLAPRPEGRREVCRLWRERISQAAYALDADESALTVAPLMAEIARPLATALVGALLHAAPAGRRLLPTERVQENPDLTAELRLTFEGGDAQAIRAAVREAAGALHAALDACCAEPQREAIRWPEVVAPPVLPGGERPLPEAETASAPPDLAHHPRDPLAIPKESFREFAEGTGPLSVRGILTDAFPLSAPDGAWRLEVEGVRLGDPPVTPEQCAATGSTYGAPLLVRAVLYDARGRLRREEEVDLGLLPLLDDQGCFVWRGQRRVVVSELAPAPGLLLYDLGDEEGWRAVITPRYGPAVELSVRSADDTPRATVEGLGRVPPAALVSALPGADGAPQQSGDAALLQSWPAATPEAAGKLEAQLRDVLTAPMRYSLGTTGRRRLPWRDEGDECDTLRAGDVAAAALRLVRAARGEVAPDCPVALRNRVLRPVGVQLGAALRGAVVEAGAAVAQRLEAAGKKPPRLGELLDCLPLTKVVSDYVSNSRWAQWRDSLNWLARLEHARRVLIEPPSGYPRDRAPRSFRSLPPDLAGRLCLLETPEGPNLGLTLELATGVTVDSDGFLLAPVRRVERGQVTGGVIGLPPADERDRSIASAVAQRDEYGNLLGPSVCCRRNGEVVRVAPQEVDYADAGDGSLLGHAGSLIPALAHCDPMRALMGANMQRQAVRVLGEEPPLVATGVEPLGNGEWLGRNVLVAYLPWYGHNYEDAIVVSDAFAWDGALTSPHREVLSVALGPDDHTTREPTGYHPSQTRALDSDGLARVGCFVEPGDVLVGVRHHKLANGDEEEDALRELLSPPAAERCLVCPPYVRGVVTSLRIGDPGRDGRRTAEVVVESLRRLARGDKLASRHGSKGVIGKIVPVAEMPHLEDGTPVEMALTPLGVPSRMNFSQLLECSLGWAAARLGTRVVIPPLRPVPDEFLRSLLRRAGLPPDGKVPLVDGRTGRRFERPVHVGYLYLMKLDHMAADKIHGRSTGPYSAITQQPVGGRTHAGGQRQGEMEFWALQAHGAAHNLREMVTIKSDDVAGREAAYRDLLEGRTPSSFGSPELLNVLVAELRALGLDVQLVTRAQEDR